MTTVPTPKHYWKFDESSGNIAKDSTGGADITLDRDDCWVTGKFGNAVRFDPSGGVKTATAFQLETSEIPQPWTASFWVQRGDAGKPASLFSSDKYALRLQQVDALDKAGITIFHQADKHFDLGIPTGTWTHLTMVGTANDTKLYVNGELKATLTTPINLGMHWLGSTHGHQDYAVALLDEVKVWDVALTGDQVKEVSNENTDQPVNSPPPPISTIFPLAGYYTYDITYETWPVVFTDAGPNRVNISFVSGTSPPNWSLEIVSPTQAILHGQDGSSTPATLVAPNTIQVDMLGERPRMFFTKNS